MSREALSAPADESNAGLQRPVELIVDRLAALAPVEVDASEDLRRALGYLDVGFAAEHLVRAGYGAGGIVTVLIVPLVSITIGSPFSATTLALVLAAATTHLVHRAPIGLAAIRRTQSLGTSTDLIGRAVLRLRIEPTPERAAAFAAASDDGPLAESLAAHVRRARGTPRSGLGSFADEWSRWFPELKRSTTLLRTASTAPPERRDRALDRALDVVVSGTRDRLAAFVGDVRGPVTGLYAFGVLLPIALVALVPAARATGAPISISTVIVVYDVLLPLGLIAASAWLLVRRPVAFPPPRVTHSHPGVPDRRWPAIGGGIAAALVAGAAASFLLPSWTVSIAGIGTGAGVALVLDARPRRQVHEHVRDVESGLPDALTLIGGRVAEGESVEAAIEEAGEVVDGATGELFADGARRCETLRIGIRDAFVGEDGALRDLPSDRAHGAAALLAIAAREGRPAGDVLLDLADQLEALNELESEARRDLATVTGTLTNTAAVFGPLVAGATVALASAMEPATGVGAIGADGVGLESVAPGGSASGVETAGSREVDARTNTMAIAALGRAIGAYVLQLAAILTALATALERGFDPTILAYRVGIALPTATATYLVSFVGAGLLL